uniref:Uncharacterized protein n=1 Tax=Rhizophora mucronata TaxID=61149 RepID=A0A2P2NWB6_RHIMU
MEDRLEVANFFFFFGHGTSTKNCFC